MAEVTDADVANARQEVQVLEETAAGLRRQLAASEASRNNSVRLQQLEGQQDTLRSEIEQLERQLAASQAPVTQPTVTGEADTVFSAPVTTVPTAPTPPVSNPTTETE